MRVVLASVAGQQSLVAQLSERVPRMATLSIDTEAFAAVRASQGLDTVQALAAALSLDKGTVSRALNGETAPGPKFISSVLLTFPVKFEDVFTIVDVAAPTQTQTMTVPAAA